MHALHMTGVSYVTNYNDAVAMFEKAKPQRRDGSGDRALPERPSSKVTGISMRGENVVFTYHVTDVVTWKPDNTCVLDLNYESQSTANFANRFTPENVYVFGEADVVGVGERGNTKYYAHTGNVVVSKGEIITGNRPVKARVVDRKDAKAALAEANFPAFSAWYKPIATFWERDEPARIGGRKKIFRRSALHRGGHIPARDMITMLKDPEQWEALSHCSTFGIGLATSAFLNALREAIYRHENCYEMVEREFAPSYDTLRKWMRDERANRWR